MINETKQILENTYLIIPTYTGEIVEVSSNSEEGIIMEAPFFTITEDNLEDVEVVDITNTVFLFNDIKFQCFGLELIQFKNREEVV